MSAQDRARWDQRYAERGAPAPHLIAPAAVFEAYIEEFPTSGHALDLACGQGTASVWLAHRGLHVVGFDASQVAIDQARALALRSGVGSRCRFGVADFDNGLPDGPPADVVYCTCFRDERLDAAIAARLAPGGVLAVSALSQVDGAPGRFRVAPGALRAAYGQLDVIADGATAGVAWLLARRADADLTEKG